MKKRFTSMMLAILTVLSLFSTTALAADSPHLNGVRAAGVNIREGSTSYPAYIQVYPAYFDGKTFIRGDEKPRLVRNWNGTATINQYARISTAETTDMLNEFRQNHNRDANMWVVISAFDIYNDSKGSYAKYYKMTPQGRKMFLVDDDGTITMDLSNFSGKYKRYSTTTYYAVENTTSQYTVGISGGYYYYNAVTRKNLSKAIGSLVIFNFD